MLTLVYVPTARINHLGTTAGEDAALHSCRPYCEESREAIQEPRIIDLLDMQRATVGTDGVTTKARVLAQFAAQTLGTTNQVINDPDAVCWVCESAGGGNLRTCPPLWCQHTFCAHCQAWGVGDNTGQRTCTKCCELDRDAPERLVTNSQRQPTEGEVTNAQVVLLDGVRTWLDAGHDSLLCLEARKLEERGLTLGIADGIQVEVCPIGTNFALLKGDRPQIRWAVACQDLGCYLVGDKRVYSRRADAPLKNDEDELSAHFKDIEAFYPMEKNAARAFEPWAEPRYVVLCAQPPKGVWRTTLPTLYLTYERGYCGRVKLPDGREDLQIPALCFDEPSRSVKAQFVSYHCDGGL